MVKRTGWQRLVAVVYPERCACCGKPVPCGKIVCDACRPRLCRIRPPVCVVCGSEKQDCRCGGRHRHTDRCISPFYHESAAKSALHRLKFGGKRAPAEMFGLAMAQVVKQEYAGWTFDLVVPVPLHKSTRREYNQSALLARELTRGLHVPCREEILVKRYATAPQRKLPAYRRSGNVLGVFDVTEPDSVRDARILLVDDTVTTGATLDECAKMLKLYGAKTVGAVTATFSRRCFREKG